MVFKAFIILFVSLLGFTGGCSDFSEKEGKGYGAGLQQRENMTDDWLKVLTTADVREGAERMDDYLNDLLEKKVALVVNHSSRVGEMHLIDTLLSRGVEVVRIFAPEHGMRGTGEAGEVITSGIDEQTGLPVISLYGKNKKPRAADLKGIDQVVFDIQDVGARFYTYISTMHYVMEACAENGIPVMVLDRPNPNGFYVDGPVLEESYRSFIGMHPVPVVHGMTIGEYARMINGEGWLKGGVKADLEVVEMEGYDHTVTFDLPVPPSPNLVSREAVLLYPSICLFEGTVVSVGRGTEDPFTVIGHPKSDTGDYFFTPRSMPGAAADPSFKGKECRGFNLSRHAHMILRKEVKPFTIQWLQIMYSAVDVPDFFENSSFRRLAGNDLLREQITDGVSLEDIGQSWQEDLEEYKKIRKKYLIYKDFE